MDDDSVCEIDLESTRKNRRLKTMKQHVSLVDEIERGLSRALQAYREHAEEALARHLVDLENAEAHHELEMAKLRAENSRLREALGVKNSTDNCLPQTVLFNQDVTGREIVSVRRKSTHSNPSKLENPSRGASPYVEEKFLHARKSVKQTSPGGGWTHFVAWVPDGAFLKSPEPWRPLPPDIQLPRGGEVAALPGMVPPGPEFATDKKRGKDKDKDDADSSDSDCDGEEREPFVVSEVWKASNRLLERLKTKDNAMEFQSRGSGSNTDSNDAFEDDAFELPTAKSFFIIHPQSHKRMAWDVGSLVMVVYDMIMIPMGAFSLPQNEFLLTMDWITRLFWTADMGWSVCTAVLKADGKIDYDFKYILKRYLRTWFALDILIVSSDWLEVIIHSSSIVGLGRLARGFRIARVVRLLRLVRMQEVMRAMTERIQTDRVAFLLSCTKLMTLVLVTSHILACVWWALGMHEDSDGASWIRSAGCLGLEVGQQYLVSLHWALSHFTGGMDEVTPVTSLERFFTVVTWSIAFMATLCISSSLTSTKVHQCFISGAHTRQLGTLRKYLKQNNVGTNLVTQVQRSVQHVGEKDDLPPEQVELLTMVAEPLRVEINYQIFSRIMKDHPLFADYCSSDLNVVRRVCHLAMATVLLDRGDVVFAKGERLPRPKMYFVAKGLLDYSAHGESIQVGERQWLSEANLWTAWSHKGTCVALTSSKMAALDSQTFQELVRKFRGKAGFDCRLYASEFIDFLNKTPKADDLSCMV